MSEARRAVILLGGALGDKLGLTGTSGLAGAAIIRSGPTDSLLEMDVLLGMMSRFKASRLDKAHREDTRRPRSSAVSGRRLQATRILMRTEAGKVSLVMVFLPFLVEFAG